MESTSALALCSILSPLSLSYSAIFFLWHPAGTGKSYPPKHLKLKICILNTNFILNLLITILPYISKIRQNYL